MESELSAAFRALRIAIEKDVAPGREKSLAITNLEQSELWAKVANGEVTITKGDA